MAELDLQSLQQLPLFQNVKLADLQEFSSLLMPRTFDPGDTLMRHDAPGEEILILLFGVAKVYAGDADGNPSVVHIAGPGEVLGEQSVLEGNKRSATVVALEPCGAFAVDGLDFWTTLWLLQPVPLNMAKLLSQRLRRATAQVQAMRVLSPGERLARQFALLFDDFGLAHGTGLYLPFHLPVADLGSLSGVDRNEVHRCLHLWRSMGLVQTDNASRFHVRDIEALRKFKMPKPVAAPGVGVAATS